MTVTRIEHFWPLWHAAGVPWQRHVGRNRFPEPKTTQNLVKIKYFGYQKMVSAPDALRRRFGHRFCNFRPHVHLAKTSQSLRRVIKFEVFAFRLSALGGAKNRPRVPGRPTLVVNPNASIRGVID